MINNIDRDSKTGDKIYLKWLVGVLCALSVCAAGVCFLAWGMARGVFADEIKFPILAALSGFAAFTGSVFTIPRRLYNQNGKNNKNNQNHILSRAAFPWGLSISGAFALILILIAFSIFHQIAWSGHGGCIILSALIGGVLSGLIGAGKYKKRRTGNARNIRRRF